MGHSTIVSDLSELGDNAFFLYVSLVNILQFLYFTSLQNLSIANILTN